MQLDALSSIIQINEIMATKAITWWREIGLHLSTNQINRYTGCIKKVDKSEIALCFVKSLNIQCFFIEIDCFGTYKLQ